MDNNLWIGQNPSWAVIHPEMSVRVQQRMIVWRFPDLGPEDKTDSFAMFTRDVLL